jgi:hypothetical protein
MGIFMWKAWVRGGYSDEFHLKSEKLGNAGMTTLLLLLFSKKQERSGSRGCPQRRMFTGGTLHGLASKGTFPVW